MSTSLQIVCTFIVTVCAFNI